MAGLGKFAALSLRALAPGALALGLTATAVNALTINDTFLSSITSAGNAATVEAAIQSASNAIASLFSNPVTVNILFGTSSSVGGGQSQTADLVNLYNSYTGLLSANASANPANAILSTAVANLSHGNDANGATPILSTTANLRALGVATSGYYNFSGTFVPGGGQVYDGVITLNPAYALDISVIQHEIDEILGGGGQGSMLGSSLSANYYGGLDLYRYSAANTPSFTTSSSATSYLSVDGGTTSIVGFNQSGGGSDYGDLTNSTCHIQSAYVCSGAAAFGTGSPEYAMLESIGYDPVSSTPLPSSWLMLLSGFVGFGFFAYRRTKPGSATLAAA